MNVLEVEHLTKEFKGKKAVTDVSFSLKEGKSHALLGPNGAGKTTTLNMIAGLIKPSKGKISSPLLQKGRDLRELIGFLPQFPSFYEWMSGEEYLTLVGKLMNIPSGILKERVHYLIELVGLNEGYNRHIRGYSGGMKQRLGIAQALIHKPKLVLLDEPVSALDPFGRREVLELMKKLEYETTILFSTHILNDAEEVCETVLFMNGGRLIESGELENVKQRYTDNLIRLGFDEINNEIIIKLEELPSIEAVHIKENNSLWIMTNNIEEARNQILQLSLQFQWPLQNFVVNSLTLEEVFTKVVKG